ncbi:MAG: type II toxin-antitoxin system HicA family toxin [Gammaproteobacteria bacterium]
MQAKHRKTLGAVFKTPTLGTVVFSDIEALVVAIGGEVRKGRGSRVVFDLNGTRKYLHRPYPGKETRKYQVEELREWLQQHGITP